ncbi:MAG: DUF2027 domain-containing protein, partial [Muribaculaceae bacterium]|nr:DUF2027 domain-containing protein [Muribaculaceae bacterium]
MIQINDIVRFLNDVGGGRVTRIEGKTVYVEDNDGFERPAVASQLVVVGQAGTKASAYERPLQVKSKLVEPDKPAPQPKPKPAEPVFETPEGEKLTIVLAYEAKELKHLNTTTFFPTLVNDSNYFLYFAYLTRGADDAMWTTRYHGIIEPNYQLQLNEFGYDDLNSMDRVAVQYIAFKQDKGFKPKNPALVEINLDTTKFYKLHCFHDSQYFDQPVIELPITTADRPAKQLVIDSSALELAMREKRNADRPRPHQAKQEKKKDEPEVIDLHISQLLDNTNGLSNSDMLN